jgi:WD40 repeat protein
MAVVGPSGSGKSSAVKAGLIPALREGAIPAGRHMAASDKWFVAEMVPGSHPLEELELALWSIAVDPPPSLVEPMQRDTRGLLRTIRRILPDEEGAQLLLVIDQFEELFTLVDDEELRAFFIDSLITALRAPRTPLRVIVTLRADFYDRPLQYESLGRLLKDNTEVVLPLVPEELTWAIQEPSRRVGVRLEAGLTPLIVADLADQPGTLPLLQYALTELFERRRDSLMTRQDYEAVGGVLGALGRRAEELYADLDELGQAATRQLFLRLVNLGEGVEDTRRRVLRAELEAIAPEGAGTVARVLDQFGRARLLVFDRDPASRKATVEVAHEALLRKWQRLRRWLDESRADVRMQRLLSAEAVEWRASDREPGFLLRAARLDQFAGWAEANTVALTPDESAFLEASVAARRARRAEEEARQQQELRMAQQLAQTEKIRAEEQADSASRLRKRAIYLAVAASIMVVLVVVASLLAQRAGTERHNSQIQTAVLLANQAEADLEAGYHDRAVLLALEALEAYPYTAAAEHALAQAVTYNRALRQYTGHESVVTSVAWSPDETLVASSAGTGNNVHIWDPDTGETRRIIELPTGITGNLRDMALNVAWSPDGQRLVILTGDRYLLGSQDFDLLIYDSSSGQQLSSAEIPNQAEPGSGEQAASFVLYPTGGALAVEPESGRLATLGGDNTALVWDAGWQEPDVTLIGHDGAVNSVDWSPGGNELVTASMDGSARVWDAISGQENLRFVRHEGRVAQARWSPLGDLIASAGEDGTVRLWDSATGKQVRLIEPETESVWSLAWSPDGRRLAVGYHDGRVAIWDVTSGGQLQILAGNQGLVSDLTWSPEGDRLISSDNSGSIRVWNAASGTAWRTLPIDYVQGLDWTSDGSYLVVGGGDIVSHVEPPSLTVWDVENNRLESDLTEALQLNNLFTFFSPDDQAILFLGYEGFPDFAGGDTVYALDPWNGEVLRTFSVGGGNLIRSTNWSPDGNLVAAGRFWSDEIWVWDYATGQLLQKLTPPIGQADLGYNFVSFSPDGSKLAGAKFDTIAPVWDTKSWEVLYIIEGHEPPAEIWSVAWSPDGSRLLTTSGSEESGAQDKTARVWDAETGEELLVLRGHTKAISYGFWSPDGRRIVTASTDNTIRIWDAETGEELLTLSPPPALYGLFAALSPDGRYLATGGLGTPTAIWRVWTSKEDLIDYAKECCVVRELTNEEMAQFGLSD